MPVKLGFCVPIFASPGHNLFRTPGFPEIDPPAAIALSPAAPTSWGTTRSGWPTT